MVRHPGFAQAPEFSGADLAYGLGRPTAKA